MNEHKYYGHQSWMDVNKSELVDGNEIDNVNFVAINGYDNIYHESTSNVVYSQCDINYDISQGGGSTYSRVTLPNEVQIQIKNFWVYNNKSELELSFAATSMEGYRDDTGVTGREIENVEVIAYSSFNIVSNHGGRKRWVMYIRGEQESALCGHFWCTQWDNDIIVEPTERDIEQYMQVVERGYFVIQKWSNLHYTTKQSRERSRNAYWEYEKEEMAWDRYGCSYEEYIDHIIESCVAYQEVGVRNNSVNECKNIEIEDLLNVRVEQDIGSLNSSHTQSSPCEYHALADYNIPSK